LSRCIINKRNKKHLNIMTYDAIANPARWLSKDLY
jgi:hypothetical protein